MLNGRTALVVEEQFLIALDLQRVLEGLGVGQTLFAATAAEAAPMHARWSEIGLAIVDINSNDAAAIQLVESLGRSSVPTVLTTADLALGKDASAFPGLVVLSKPVPEDMLASAVRQALAARL